MPPALAALAPASPGEEIVWDEVGRALAGTDYALLASTPQDPVYHGEGDVLAHTRMVSEALVRMDAFWELDEEARQVLFLAVLLHDVGKVRTTMLEGGRWSSPGHAAAGAAHVRERLVRLWHMGGTPEALAARERICWIVRWHMLPMRLIGREDPLREARRVAEVGSLSGATWRDLLLLAGADALGRVAADAGELYERVALARMACEEAGCLGAPFAFTSQHVRRAYLKGVAVAPNQPLYDDTWGEVTLVCGLPGTGKDTWIARERAGMPQVSLDMVRAELGIAPTDPQGAVVQEARERARRHLRAHEAFVWNATNVTRLMRQHTISLVEDYGARVRIVYLETPWETLLERNRARASSVPERMIERLLHKLEPPTPDEAHEVAWVCV